MERKSFIDQIADTRKGNEIAYVNYFNDGVIRNDTYTNTKDMYFRSGWSVVGTIEHNLKRCGELIRKSSDFDYLELNLLIGLMYNPDDYEKNGQSIEGLIPSDTVRVLSKELCGYLNDEKLKLDEFWDSTLAFNLYVNYNDLVEELTKEGVPYNGPKSFDELKEKITTGEPFEIKTYIDLRKKEQVVSEEPKLEQVEPALTRKRCLFKRRNK
ncbi:MAG: hypothetical protein J6X02_00780 [Bacilli bacterium]|nr:hypothetical protein [Bacilli bacterium]